MKVKLFFIKDLKNFGGEDEKNMSSDFSDNGDGKEDEEDKSLRNNRKNQIRDLRQKLPQKKYKEKTWQNYSYNLELLRTYILSKLQDGEVLTIKRVKTLAQECIAKFTNLKTTFFISNPTYLKELTQKIMESHLIKEKNIVSIKNTYEEDKKYHEIRKIRRFHSDSLKIYETLTRIKKQAKSQKERIINIVIDLKNLIKELNKKRRELIEIKNEQKKKDENFDYKQKFGRQRGKNIDVLEYNRPSRILATPLINPVHIKIAEINEMKEEQRKLEQEIEEEMGRYDEVVEKVGVVKAELSSKLEYMLKKPAALEAAGFRLKDIIRFFIKLGVDLRISMLGGNFTEPEKRYLIESAKAEDLYNKQQKKLKEEINKKIRLDRKNAKIFKNFNLKVILKF